ncbi:unnamed protein product [Orchesella dallaii]|uniref:Retinoblastoma-binding protein 5 n=1 Tax=Orchesella dallaii TaxID=48710 RepID=A0ABP1S0L1_9HEXA
MMNLELLESFCQNYPEEPDGVLDCISVAVTAQYNKLGTLLAVGCNDGRVVVWDFMTRGIAKVITAHSHPVCSLSWSRNGHKILTASTDNTVTIVDVMTGDCENRFRFPSPVLKIQFHPRDPKMLLVCPLRHAALIVNIDGNHKAVPVEDDMDLNIVASFDRRGNYIYSGNSKGKVSAYSVPDLVLRASFRIGQGLTSTTAVKSVEFARRGNCFLLNSADRIIRVYNCDDVLKAGKDGDPEPVQKLQDLVNKTMWKKCCFSGDGEYICAGSARQHALYIWEKTVGNLVKILHGTKGELLLDVVWHPMRPIVASISSGVVSIWAQNQVENWSAFAPDFKELDENVEYEERESEFDLEDEDKIVEEKGDKVDDDLEVDVTTCDPITAYVSSDEGGEDPDFLMFLPIAPDVVEDIDESVAAAQAAAQAAAAAAAGHGGDHHKENRRKKPRTHDVKLENAPTDETHPLLNKPGHGGGSSSGKKSSSHSSSHHHHHHHHRPKSDKEKKREKIKS